MNDGRGAPRSILVTGGAGFVGTNLADRLASRGDRVVVYDDLSRPGVTGNLRWLTRKHGERVVPEVASVTEADRLSVAVGKADAVFHLAAQVAVTTSVRDPERDFEVNVRGTLNLLEALRELGRPVPLVFTSTNKVYGDLRHLEVVEDATRYRPADERLRRGISESHPLRFQSPYGCSKGAADQYVLDYARLFGIPGVVLRMSCIYGPHQHGTEDQGWVAHFLLRALEERPITIYGDGKQVRDILFVSDLVDALEQALEGADRLAGRAFNVGGGPENALSLLELLRRIAEVGGRGPDVVFEDWRPADQRWYVSDTTRFREATGWRPSVTKAEGIALLAEWLRRDGAAGAKSAAAVA